MLLVEVLKLKNQIHLPQSNMVFHLQKLPRLSDRIHQKPSLLTLIMKMGHQQKEVEQWYAQRLQEGQHHP